MRLWHQSTTITGRINEEKNLGHGILVHLGGEQLSRCGQIHPDDNDSS
jgi:hypothetical protein